MMKQNEQKKAARAFADFWKDHGYEKGETQAFWLSLLRDVFGVEHPEVQIVFEEKVKLAHASFIDARIPATNVIIEQKGSHVDLSKGAAQSDSAVLTPKEQAQRYGNALPYSQRPRWIVVCNFRLFLVYDMEHLDREPERIELKDLPEEYSRLTFLTAPTEQTIHIQKETKLSTEAGELAHRLRTTLAEQYLAVLGDGSGTLKPEISRDLNKLCVRLVFCFYAEDAGFFGKKQFRDYLTSFHAEHARTGLIELFKVLDTPVKDRDPFMNEHLAAFPYVNGGLFEGDVQIPRLNEKILHLILVECCDKFNWSEISPTIFGAIFESALTASERRSGGMHYTSIENIHKVIDPLFLDALKSEFEQIRSEPVVSSGSAKSRRRNHLRDFQSKLASLKFLDPACGSGNFLTESYLSLRKLENDVLRELHGEGLEEMLITPIQVSISQFYGVEIHDFAVSVAKTALWIAESQMWNETEKITGTSSSFFPLKTNAWILEGNALQTDWQRIDPENSINYIMGNPPFNGARTMSPQQKADVERVFGPDWKNAGNLDYVTCWFKKAADLMKNRPNVRTAFVATNSVCQGDSVATLWGPLVKDGIHIDFAHRTFKWGNEADEQAHVHCVIVGFSWAPNYGQKYIYENGSLTAASRINAYLVDGADIYVESRSRPLCDVPEIGMGNQPIDGGKYLFTEEEMNEFVKKEPQAAAYFKPWYGSVEFINRSPRWCLWLGEASPDDLAHMPLCIERIDAVRKFRLQSKRASTLKLADTPTHFQTENMPKGNYIVIPEVSSEKRMYVPIGYMDDSVLCSNKLRLMPHVSLYHFGVLTSFIHMAWMRAVCGRLETRYDYSIKIVYNNFPWPKPTPEQKMTIEQTAQKILDVRAQHPRSSYADMYSEKKMRTIFTDLLAAHRENDRAVAAAYGFPENQTEAECVAELFKLYEKLAAASGTSSSSVSSHCF